MASWYIKNGTISDFPFYIASFIDQHGISFSQSDLEEMARIKVMIDVFRNRLCLPPLFDCPLPPYDAATVESSSGGRATNVGIKA